MLKHPPVQDVIEQFVDTSATEDVERLKGWHLKPTVSWNYNVVQGLVPWMVKDIPEEQILQACAKMGAPSGRKPNAGAAKAAYPILTKRAINPCSRLPVSKYDIRKDISLSTPPVFFLSEKDGSKFIMLNPRKGLALSKNQISALLLTMSDACDRDGHSGLPLEIADVSAPDGRSRCARIWSSEKVTSISSDFLVAAFQRYAAAYDELVRTGFEVPERPAPRPTPPHPDLFSR
ncbi:hypothetical protein VPG91_13210 [Nitrospirillum amazonense]|uniref:hypothetical protein n=1 Tax=Nitrospirillum amazonense TaxID=28077 RepID=UPI002DD435A0|nr:hypothetical protein [Nitrospirillum amazonense]MEC4591950.1 hypothetical protein [Nitrospirillum amazonense]